MKPRHFLLFFLFTVNQVVAQRLTKEANYEISGKANRGYMYEPVIDESNNKLSLTFVTKATNKKAKFETYNFDLDFTFKSKEDSEVPMEKVKGYRADKGDEWEQEAVTVEKNFMGTLILRRKTYKYKWNWFWGGYDRKVTSGEKLKPKTDDGGKLQYITHAEQPNGDIMIIATDKGKGLGNMLTMTTEFHILRYDHELNKLSDEEFKFDFPQTLVAANTDDADEDEENTEQKELIMVFAPMGGKGFKSVADPDAKNYSFARISTDGKLKERIPFKSKTGIFNGDMLIETNDGVYIVGATGDEDSQKDYFNEKFAAPFGMRDEEIEKFKAKGFQIVKIANGKAVYTTLNTLDDFDKKSQSPPSQKRKPEYTGRKFKVSTVKAMPNGDLMIAGQKYSKSKGGVLGGNKFLGTITGTGGGGAAQGGLQYEDIIMMHFANDGILRAAYGVRREENDKDAKSSANNQLLWVGPDGKLYWTIMEMKGWRQEKELGESKYKFLLYPNVAIVDVLNAKIGDFVQFGQGKTDYYVNNKYPMMPLKGNSQIFFFGENKSGKTLWFAKMPLE
ncbi:hypothetical protein [Lacibacter sp.]|uniref:hypothetical protein n=1 Tax=Lacibacter sp. TaxID=1915409 RepID=UPI002B4B81FA|nr:hypothetical protein [Lacibacter sp.]HLP37839.1 hypothetical protein [Lacibacter sp.]